MRVFGRILVAFILVVPSAFLIWTALQSLDLVPNNIFSFGMPMDYGFVRFPHPYGECIVILGSAISVVCGLKIGSNHPRKRNYLILGCFAWLIMLWGAFSPLLKELWMN